MTNSASVVIPLPPILDNTNCDTAPVETDEGKGLRSRTKDGGKRKRGRKVEHEFGSPTKRRKKLEIRKRKDERRRKQFEPPRLSKANLKHMRPSIKYAMLRFSHGVKLFFVSSAFISAFN